jgi:hypothetical protein
VRNILLEASQVTWKKINYFDVAYSRVQNDRQLISYGILASIRSSKVSSKPSSGVTRSQLSGKRAYQSNSLTQRVYDLRLTSRSNYLVLFIIQLFIIGILVGTIALTQVQVNEIKPTLDLNVQIIRFQLQFDSIVVQGEILKT